MRVFKFYIFTAIALILLIVSCIVFFKQVPRDINTSALKKISVAPKQIYLNKLGVTDVSDFIEEDIRENKKKFESVQINSMVSESNIQKAIMNNDQKQLKIEYDSAQKEIKIGAKNSFIGVEENETNKSNNKIKINQNDKKYFMQHLKPLANLKKYGGIFYSTNEFVDLSNQGVDEQSLTEMIDDENVKSKNARFATQSTPAFVNGSKYKYHSHYELPDAIANKKYIRKINIEKETTEVMTLLSGETLPAGLLLDGETGIISGVPVNVGPSSFALKVGSLNHIVHLMVLPSSAEVVKPTYYDNNGLYTVNQEVVTINFDTNELTNSRETSLQAVLTYPTKNGNINLVADGKFPIISLMHGSGYEGKHYTEMCKVFASHGFIVIAPTTLSFGYYTSIWRDWQVIQRRGYETILNWDLNTESKFFGHANRDAIGLIGHSWGGATTELNMFHSPARAFVLIDDIALLNNVREWNNYFDAFTEPDAFPAKASMILKGGISNYNASCVEFGGAFTGPMFLATFNDAQHENFLNADFFGWTDYQYLNTINSISNSTNINMVHHLVSFFKRYLLDDMNANANLFSPFSVTQANDLTVQGGSLAAFRPEWAGQLLIDDFSDKTISVNDLDQSVSTNLNISIDRPYLSPTVGSEFIYMYFTSNDLLKRSQFNHLHIEKSVGSPAGTFTEGLGTNELPLNANEYTHIAFEISQDASTFSNVLPLTVLLKDANGKQFELPLTSSLPGGIFKNKFAHTILLPLQDFEGLDQAKLTALTLKVGVNAQDLKIEIDNIRMERLASIPNVPPVLLGSDIVTNTNKSKIIALSATDKNGGFITYQIASHPKNGSLVVNSTSVEYTPNNNYEGYDQFKISASGGSLISNAAIFNVTVVGPTPKPTAVSQTINATDLKSFSITLSGADVNGSPLKYELLSTPTDGALTGILPNLTYSPYGFDPKLLKDSFQFKVNSGKLDSDVATVTINFTPVNHSPTTSSLSIKTSINRKKFFSLKASDKDLDSLTYSVSVAQHGVVSGVAPNLVYTPHLNYVGSDSFTYTVSDGIETSTPAKVSITIINSNTKPIANSQTITAYSGFSLKFALTLQDNEYDSLTFELLDDVKHGTLSEPFISLTKNCFEYIPESSFEGIDQFNFKTNDGLLDSDIGTVTFNVIKPQLPPVPVAQTYNVINGVSKSILLSAIDPNNDLIYYEVLTQPLHGLLSGTAPNLTYIAEANYFGTDSFLIKASDGRLAKTVNIKINVSLPVDTTAPSEPTNVFASLVTQNSLRIGWTASSDTVGVVGYRVFKDGVQIGTTASTNYAVSSLTANTNYSFQVSAYDAANNTSSLSSILTVKTLVAPDTTAPSVPINVSASLITENSLKLGWTASIDAVGVVGYRVFKDGVQIGSTSSTNYSVSGLIEDTSYSFRVSAYDAANNSSVLSGVLSVKTSGATDAIAPTVPILRGAFGISETEMTVKWDASSDNVAVAGYKVFKDGGLIGTTSGVNFRVTNLNGGTYYVYTVSAFDAAGNMSALSNALTLKTKNTLDSTPPSAPTSVSVSLVTQNSLRLGWTASSDVVGVVGYRVFKDGVQIGTTASTNYAVSSLTANTNYSFQVSAYDAANNSSSLSSILTVKTLVTPDITAPSVPTNVSASLITENSLKLGWTASSDVVGVVGYRVFKDGVQIGATSLTNYSVSGLSVNTSYSFRVSAYDAANNSSALSGFLNIKTSGPSDTIDPTIPVMKGAYAISETEMTISWDASSDNVAVAGYKVYKDDELIGTTTEITYQITGLNSGTYYKYTVSAFDLAGNNSDLSNSISVRTTPKKFFLSISKGPNGSISPEGYIFVYQGFTRKITITPDANYEVDTVTINGLNAGALTSFSISNVSMDFTIHATFKPLVESILAKSFSGSVSEEGQVSIVYGESQSFTMNALEGYSVDKARMDGFDINEFSGNSFKPLEVILLKNTNDKTGRSNENNLNILEISRKESKGILKISYEIDFSSNDINQSEDVVLNTIYGEVFWVKDDTSNQEISLPDDIVLPDHIEAISIRLTTIDDDEVVSSIPSEPKNEDTLLSGSSSGGCNYSKNMPFEDQIANLLMLLLYMMFALIRLTKNHMVKEKE